MSIQGQSITNNANMLQTTIGIVSTLPVDLTEDANREKEEDTREKNPFKICLVDTAKESNRLRVSIQIISIPLK